MRKTNTIKTRKALGAMLMLLFLSSQVISQEDIYDMDLQQLMNMEIVSASKQKESLFDAPLAASVVKSEDMKKAGCTSIMEALRMVPGVIVREVTPGNYDIHLRGYDAIDPNAMIALTSNTITLVMINNRPVYSEFQGQTNWELQQLGIDDIDRIEVIRGPASAMYGPNAVAGVINIITKEPDAKKGFHVSTYSQVGNYNAMIGNVNLGYNMENGFSVRGGINYDKRDRHFTDYYVLSQKDFVDELDESIVSELGYIPINPDEKPLNAKPNIHERFPDKDLATDRYTANIHTKYKKDDFEVNLMAINSDATVQRVWARNQVTALTYEESNQTSTQLWGKFKGLTYSIDYNDGGSEIIGSGEVLASNYNWMYGNLEYDINIGDHFKVKPGGSYRNTSFNAYSLGSTRLNTTNYTYEKDEGDITNSMISGHLQAEYNSDKFRLIGAIRADKFEYPDKTIVNPLIASTYKISDNFLVRGSYGRSARTPFIMDLFFNIDLLYPNYGQFDYLNPSLDYLAVHYRGTERADDIPGSKKRDYEPLTIDDAQIGFRHKISETFQLDIELFWSKISNMVTTANLYEETNVSVLIDSSSAPPTPIDTTITHNTWNSFVNIDAEPTQTGATLSITSAPFNNTTFQIFVTVQQTKVTKYYEALDKDGNAIDADGDGKKYLDDYYHLATPPFYGGFNMNFKPIKKLNLNLNPYFYGHQTLTFGSKYTEEAEANIIMNATATYEITDGIKVFANGRNLLGNNYRQFAFADKIGATILGGVNIQF